MKKYDVVIAGAGVAGCLAARNLAMRGLSVAILESKAKHELGHDWWDSVDASVFAETGLDYPRKPELMEPFNFDILSPLGDTGMRAAMPPEVVNIDRKLFAKRLLEAAEGAGVKVYFRARIAGPIIEGGNVAGAVAERGGKKTEYRARISIDATGPNGALRIKTPSGWGFDPKIERGEFVLAYREIRANTDPAGRSILVVGEHGGVRWLSRDQGDIVDIIAVVLDRPGRKNPKETALKMVRDEGGVGGEILRAGCVERIPVRRSLDSFVAPGLMLIGDSASMANPINGSGASSALRAARIAASVAADAIVAGKRDVPSLWRYNYEYKLLQDTKFAKLQMLQNLLFSERPENVHEFLSTGFMPPDGFWNAPDLLQFSNALPRLPMLLPLAGRAPFLLRLAGVFALASLLDNHYKAYPEKYDEKTFSAWRKRSQLLFDLVPKAM